MRVLSKNPILEDPFFIDEVKPSLNSQTLIRRMQDGNQTRV